MLNEFYPFIIALIFNAFDLISGIVAAVREKNLQSSKLRDGLFKKVGFIFCYEFPANHCYLCCRDGTCFNN